MTTGEAASRKSPRDGALAFGVAAVTVASVAIIAGVHPETQVALAAAVVVMAAAHAFLRGERGVRSVPLAGVAALGVIATLIQLVPLPVALVKLLSPNAYDLRAAVSPDARFMPLTLDVPATWLAAARGVACLGLLVVADGLVRSRQRARRLAWLLALVGGTLAAVAFAQRFTGAQKILGLYTPRGTPGFGFFGTFVDVNHCASVLAIGTLVAAGLAVERHGRERGLAILLGVLSGSALVFTASRGGLVGFAAGAVVMVLVLGARAVGVLRATIAAVVILLAGASLTLWAHEGLRARTIAAPSQLWSNQKVRGWSDGMRLADAYRWTGVGRGAFEAPVNAYRAVDEGVRLVYPEDVVVQLASEWGIPVALALLLLAFSRAGRLAPSVATLPAGAVGAAAAVVAVVVHELTDFGLEMPGVALPAIVALAIVTGSIAVADRRERRPRPKNVPAAASIPALVIGALVVIAAAVSARHTLDRDWQAAAAGSDDAELNAAIARHPADDYLELVAAQRALKQTRPELMAGAMPHLNRALALHPRNWQAHRMAARLLAAWKRPAQAALEYRLAVESGMSWDVLELARVLGAHVVEAVPQTPAALDDLARELYNYGKALDADAAAARAADISDAREPLLVKRAELALAAQSTIPSVDKARAAAGNALLAEAATAEEYVLAARALAAAGDKSGANHAIDVGLTHFPRAGSVYLGGARLRSDAGDLAGARTLLSRAGQLASLSLADRLHAEELLAEVADKLGDPALAVQARARSKMIAQRIRDMSFSQESH
jgi:hypothetical protein